LGSVTLTSTFPRCVGVFLPSLLFLLSFDDEEETDGRRDARRKTFSDAELDQDLKTAGLVPSAVLIVS
jgi:hypothetical protein